MRLGFAVAIFALAAWPTLAQKPTREEEQRQRQALDRYKKGQELMTSERLEEAVREFKAAIELDPLLTLAHFRLGQAYMGLRQYPQAEQAFLACRVAYEKIAGLEFTNREELERRRAQEVEQLQNQIVLMQTGQTKGGNPSLIRQLQTRIDDLERNRRKGGAEVLSVPAEVNVSLGSAYFRQGKMELAEKEWKTAADANPKLGEAHNNLAALYLMSGELDDAEKELKLAEKCGYPVHPRLKDDIKKARKGAPSN